MSESTKPLVALQGVSAVVTLGNKDRLTTVNDVSLELFAGMTYSIVGKSGAGKTSLISIIGMLNTQFSGRYLHKGQDVGALSDRRLSFMRAGHIGFVFQNYSLIGHLSALENVELALWYGQHARRPRATGASASARRRRCLAALASVGLRDKARELPKRLSGGEQQRVAIARALVNQPELLICDEPTGALDTKTSGEVLSVLRDAVREHATTLLLVTHDDDLAATCDITYTMSGGELHAPSID